MSAFLLAETEGSSADAELTLLDGTVVVVEVPSEFAGAAVTVTGLNASVRISGSCCAREVSVFSVGAGTLLSSSQPVLVADPLDAASGGLYGVGRGQVFVLGTESASAVIAASPSRPFSVAELDLYRKFLVLRPSTSGVPVLDAAAPLVVETPPSTDPTTSPIATLEFSGEPSLLVELIGGYCAPFARFGRPREIVRCDADIGVVSTTGSSPQDQIFEANVTSIRPPASSPQVIQHTFDAQGEPISVVQSDNGGTMVVGLRETDGAILWSREFGPTAMLLRDSVSDAVFIFREMGDVYSLDLLDGSIRWHVAVDGLESIDLVDDRLILRSGGRESVFDALTGVVSG